jgi:hypothetical protein
MNLTKYVLPISFLIMLPCLIVAQQSREQGIKAIKSKLLDVPDAPYKLNASYNGRGYQFCNRSAARVTKFRLGCVKKKNGVLEILSERPSEAVGLAPAEVGKFHCRFWSSNHGFFPGEACKKGKLAVIEVEFADSAIWKLK